MSKIARHPGVWQVTSLTTFACLLILAAGVYYQSQVHINHDVAWIAHSAAWLLDGKRFGTDILDVNPPLAWFLMLPAALAARWRLVSEVVAIQTWTWMLTVGGLAISVAVLVPMARLLGRVPVIGLLVVGVAVAAILPIGNFGQRDVLAFILILPYLFSMMGRAGGVPATGRALPLLIGFAAGVGVCLKPFLFAVPVLIELMHLALTRNLRSLIRAETLAMAATMLLYAGAILLFARDYLEFAIPLIRAVYWAYDASGNLLRERFQDAAMPAVYALGIALATLSFNRLHAVLVAAIAGFAISYWVQGKGFPYHAFPLLGAGCLYLAFAVVQGIDAVRKSTRIARRELRWMIIAVLLLVALPVLCEPFTQAHQWYLSAHRKEGEWGRLREGVIERLHTLGVGPADYLYAISTHPNPGFPTVNYLGARWASREVAQFAVPAYVRRVEVLDSAVLREIDRAMALQVAEVVDALRIHQPAYVMVEARQRRLGLALRKFDDLAYYGRHAEFARLWSCYEEVDPVGQIRLFARRAGCTPPPG